MGLENRYLRMEIVIKDITHKVSLMVKENTNGKMEVFMKAISQRE